MALPTQQLAGTLWNPRVSKAPSGGRISSVSLVGWVVGKGMSTMGNTLGAERESGVTGHLAPRATPYFCVSCLRKWCRPEWLLECSYERAVRALRYGQFTI